MATDSDIADHLDLAQRNVQVLRSKGVLPPAGSDLTAARIAYIRHMRENAAGRIKSVEKVDLDTEKARLAREQADQVAMKNAAMRGELVSLVEVRSAVVGMIETTKRHLARVPAKAFPNDIPSRKAVAVAIEAALIDLSAERATPTQSMPG